MKFRSDSSGFEIQIKKVDELATNEWRVWNQFRNDTEWLNAPFFSPNFVRAVARLNAEVRVAVVRKERSIIGFWPFELQGRTGKPVASSVTEMNGLIARPDCPLVLSSLLSSMGLDRWHFDCVPSNQVAFTPYVIRKTDSHYISLHDGFEGYRQHLYEKGSRQLHENERKLRKLEREYGTVNWVWHSSESSLLDLMTRWKRDQYQRTGMLDVLGVPLVQNLLRSLIDQPTETFGGVISCLSIGDQPIAVHYGLRDNNVLASWFQAYDPEFGAYSPGRIAILKLVEESFKQGIERIDLGQGDERYKLSLRNGSSIVGEGVVCRRKMDRLLMKTWIRTRELASSNSCLRVPLQWFRQFRNQRMRVTS